MRFDETRARRLQLLKYLATCTEPALIIDLARACGADAREIRSDVRFLKRDGLVIAKRHRGMVKAFRGEYRQTTYLAVSITDKGLSYLTSAE
jgi:predicted transcriptional regulator